ncbi:MAG TPA: SIR2 family protein [Solirubrobacterales bacterium]|nr:SIR2 family protein [Solirubrobacterales bacterium]
MNLDPIVSLSVAVAEAPGSHAFLLGSGVSREAGVPTGQQVFWQAVGELYRLEEKTSETPDENELGEWLKKTDREGLGYSAILELIAPDPANRRDYLAKHFEGREPGPAHHVLASLAEAKAIRVFITTNFDRLLEHALQARGIEPVIITSAADLASAPRREHADCYVLKPHGDYLQETIRNTPSELEELEPEIAAELEEIFERFGVVVLGYSGSDAGIAGLLSARRSRYGLYWVARSELADGASRIIEATGGRMINREGAAEFVADLQRRLEVFRTHPSGHTPVEVHDEVLTLVRVKDEIGLAEVMRRERREFTENVNAVIAAHREEGPEENNLLAAHDKMLPLWERRLAGLLPVIAYAPSKFESEVRSLIDALESRPLEGGFTAWPELLDWGTWWLGFAAGAFALYHESWLALAPLLAAKFSNFNDRERHLVEPVRESIGHELGALVMARFSETNWMSPRWEHLSWSLLNCRVLQERWPEFLQGREPRLPALVNFDLLVTIRIGLDGGSPIAHWLIYRGGGVQFARRLRNDPRYRNSIIETLGADPDGFIETVGAALQGNLRNPGNGFTESGALNVLLADQ